MSTRIKLAALAVALAGLCNLTPFPARAAVWFNAGLEINSPADFYSPLAPYGAWETVAPYGRCWHPVEVAADWRPYGSGYWESTDCGWYWVSDEPWAWACYHYGSWVYDSFYGWVWVPATEWAPAWVVWRESPEYIGWAPCGPAGFSIAPAEFMFVDVHHFHDRLRPGVFIINNATIINRTRFVNNISRTTRSFGGVSRRVVVNRGPDPSIVERATGTRFTARPVQEVVSHTPAPAAVPRSRSGVVMERPVLPAPQSSSARHEQMRTPKTSRREAPAPAPAGREGSRGYQRDRTPSVETQRPESRSPAPTGRETPRVYPQNPTPVPAPKPPPREFRTPSSTGREVPRAYPQPPAARTPAPTGQPPSAPPGESRRYVPQAVPPPDAPRRPEAPPGQERRPDRDRDRDH